MHPVRMRALTVRIIPFKFYSNQWPDNNSYDGWWGNDTLPKLNYEEADTLEQYILGIGKNGYPSRTA